MSDLIKREDVMKAIFGIHIEDIMTGDRIAFDKMLIEINKAVEAIPSVEYHPARADGKSMQRMEELISRIIEGQES